MISVEQPSRSNGLVRGAFRAAGAVQLHLVVLALVSAQPPAPSLAPKSRARLALMPIHVLSSPRLVMMVVVMVVALQLTLIVQLMPLLRFPSTPFTHRPKTWHPVSVYVAEE